MQKQPEFIPAIPLNINDILIKYNLDHILDNIPKKDNGLFHIKVASILLIEILEIQRLLESPQYHFMFSHPYNCSATHSLDSDLFFTELSNLLKTTSIITWYCIENFIVKDEGNVFSFSLTKIKD